MSNLIKSLGSFGVYGKVALETFNKQLKGPCPLGAHIKIFQDNIGQESHPYRYFTGTCATRIARGPRAGEPGPLMSGEFRPQAGRRLWVTPDKYQAAHYALSGQEVKEPVIIEVYLSEPAVSSESEASEEAFPGWYAPNGEGKIQRVHQVAPAHVAHYEAGPDLVESAQVAHQAGLEAFKSSSSA